MRQQTSGNTVLWVIIAVLVTILVIGGGTAAILLLSGKDEVPSVTPTATPPPSVSDDFPVYDDDYPVYIDDEVPVTTRDMTVEGNSPTDIAERFILCTLGTVPGSRIDYAKARSLMSAARQAEFTDDSYIPSFYGIQDGPDRYEMKLQTISGNSASVTVDVVYGEMMMGWAFLMVREGGEWRVDGIRTDAQ